MIPNNGYAEKSVDNFHKWIAEKEHKIMDEQTSVFTIGKLKDIIEDLPDETEVYLFTNDNTYYLDCHIGFQKCIAQDGKSYISEGLIFEVY